MNGLSKFNYVVLLVISGFYMDIHFIKKIKGKNSVQNGMIYQFQSLQMRIQAGAIGNHFITA